MSDAPSTLKSRTSPKNTRIIHDACRHISGSGAGKKADASSDEEPPEPEFDVPDTPQTGTTPAGFPPSLDLFGPSVSPVTPEQSESIVTQGNGIISTLADFGVEAELAETIVGPTVIQFQLQLAPGIKVSRISGLANDLALTLAVPALRVEAPIPGKPFVGIEIPNPNGREVSPNESRVRFLAESRIPLPRPWESGSTPGRS